MFILTNKTIFKRMGTMNPQIERLRKDSKEMKHYIFKLEKKGKTILAAKMKCKLEYLNSQIGEIDEDLVSYH